MLGVKPDYKYSQEWGRHVCSVPFVPILCPSSVSHCWLLLWGEVLTVGFAVVQERFCATGTPLAQPGRHSQASAGTGTDREVKPSKNGGKSKASRKDLVSAPHSNWQ